MSWLWNELHDLFDPDDEDDNWFPEIYINYTKGEATVAGYALLRRRAERVVTEKPYFWSKVHDAEQALDSVSNAAALVVAGEAEPFYVVLGGIQAHNTIIPDLGVFVFVDGLNLDYRMGPHWGPCELEALFQVLVELAALDSNATISLDENFHADEEARFQKAWRRWAAQV
jgi:hypothetical protein